MPATDASGLTSRGENSETANSTTAAPPPVSPAADPADSIPPNSPPNMRPIPATASTPAITASTPRRPLRSGSAASSSAVIGVTRVARSAGMIAATRATPMPKQTATIAVRAWNWLPVLGRSIPIAFISALSPAAAANPPGTPSGGPEAADQGRLAHDGGHDLRSLGAERPQQPELADALSDRDRERVEDKERRHHHDHPGQHEQRDREELEVGLAISSPSRPAFSLAVSARSVGGSTRCTRSLSTAGGTPSAAAMKI